MSSGMIVYVKAWEFDVISGSEQQFERIYGPQGDWAQLMKNAEGYLNTQLLRDVDQLGRYVTMDYWNSKAAFDAFKLKFPAEYKALDEQCESSTEQEKPIGSFSWLKSESPS